MTQTQQDKIAYLIRFLHAGKVDEWVRFAPAVTAAAESADNAIKREFPGEATELLAVICMDRR